MRVNYLWLPVLCVPLILRFLNDEILWVLKLLKVEILVVIELINPFPSFSDRLICSVFMKLFTSLMLYNAVLSCFSIVNYTQAIPRIDIDFFDSDFAPDVLNCSFAISAFLSLDEPPYSPRFGLDDNALFFVFFLCCSFE